MAESNIAYAVFIVVLLIALGLSIAWGVYGYQQITSRSIEFVESPYCVRTVCGSGSEPVVITLSNSDDPQRVTYQTTAWCITNAPPTGFTKMLADGAAAPSDSDLIIGFANDTTFTTLLLGFSVFYVGTSGTVPAKSSYTGSCGYAWTAVPTFNDIPEADSLTNLNQFGGINDQVWINCVNVMGKIVAVGSPSPEFTTQYNFMKDMCGQACIEGAAPNL